MVPSFQNNGSPVPQILKQDGNPPDLRPSSQSGESQRIRSLRGAIDCSRGVVWLQGRVLCFNDISLCLLKWKPHLKSDLCKCVQRGNNPYEEMSL